MGENAAAVLQRRRWHQTAASPRSLLAFGTQVLEQRGTHGKFQGGLSSTDEPQSLHRNFPGHGRNLTFISSTASHHHNKQRLKKKPTKKPKKPNQTMHQLILNDLS